MRSGGDWADVLYDVSWGADVLWTGIARQGGPIGLTLCMILHVLSMCILDGNRMADRADQADAMYDVSCGADVLWTGIARQGVSIALQTALSGDDWADAMCDVSCAVDVHLGRKSHDSS
eukprot:285432-Hanusia_phi.AAC.1